MNLASIASGSSGNCIYVGNEKSHFLIDAGISRKRIVEGLTQMEVAPETIQGIFVTHEHMDPYQWSWCVPQKVSRSGICYSKNH